MKIVNGYPPNIIQIRAVLGEAVNTIYCYGETIYNPSGKDIPPDILFHEQVHSEQQRELGPELWWLKYLSNRAFRQAEEVAAYARQYHTIKKHTPVRAHKEALWELAHNLATIYDLELTHQLAEELIRTHGHD